MMTQMHFFIDKMWLCALTLTVVLFSSKDGVGGHNISDIKRLKNKLFGENEYDKTVRPVIEQDKPVQVHLLMSVTNIVNFDITQAKLETTGFIMAYWIDENISWNASEYGGITRLVVEPGDIWTPRLTLLDNVAEMGNSQTVSTVSVSPIGGVTWISAGNFHTFCDLNMRKYPRDSHACNAVVLSYWYTSKELQLTPFSDVVDTSNLRDNGAWTITHTSTSKSEFNIALFSVTTDLLLNTIVLIRRPDFIMIHKGIPLAILGMAILFSHLIPLTSSERTSYSVTLLLAFIFWQAMIVAELPDNSSKISILSIVKIVAMCTTMLSVLASVFLGRVARRKDTNIPHNLVRLVEICTRCRSQAKRPPTVKDADTSLHDVQEAVAKVKNGQSCTHPTKDYDDDEPDYNDDKITWHKVACTIDTIIWIMFMVITFVTVSAFLIVVWMI